jgi:CRP-like cAMP-binding protein
MAQTNTPHSSNNVLAGLPAADMRSLLPHLRSIELPQGMVLFEAGQSITRVFFPHAGVVSLVVELASGEMIEAAMIGREGVVGGLAALDSNISIGRAIVQIAGAASVVDVDHVRKLAARSTAFRTTLIKHEQLLLAQSQQSAACNATHTIEARLSRWLLRCRDLVGSEELQLTQEFIAQMLGVRRTRRPIP